MSRFPLVILLAAFGACRKQAPTTPPTPEALGAEIATFHQVLVPISTQTFVNMREAAARRGIENVSPGDFLDPYALGSVLINGQTVAVFTAYTGPWQAPREMPTQPMSIQQFLRAFGSDQRSNLAAIIAPKGNIFFTREQLLDVIGAARASGASSEDIPFTVIRGSGR